MKENNVIQKIVDAEYALNTLLDDYNKLLKQYKQQTSFAQKIKQAILIKKVDAAIYNILNTTAALIQYAVLKSILSPDLAQHYIQLFKSKFNTYINSRNNAFSTRKSKILQRGKQRAIGANKEASLQSVPPVTTPEAVF